MTDLMIVELTKAVLWALAFTLVVVLFRHQIASLLQSLGSFNVAGASFTLRDGKKTLQSYILLSETFIEVISSSPNVEHLAMQVAPPQAEKLGNFCLLYTAEIGEAPLNEALLRNVAHLLTRHGRYRLAIQVYDALLARRPDELQLLGLKALAMLVSRLPPMVKDALAILEPLANRYPEDPSVRFNLAAAYSLSGEHDKCVKTLQNIPPLLLFAANPNWQIDPLLFYTRQAMPERLAEIQAKVEAARKTAQR